MHRADAPIRAIPWPSRAASEHSDCRSQRLRCEPGALRADRQQGNNRCHASIAARRSSVLRASRFGPRRRSDMRRTRGGSWHPTVRFPHTCRQEACCAHWESSGEINPNAGGASVADTASLENQMIQPGSLEEIAYAEPDSASPYDGHIQYVPRHPRHRDCPRQRESITVWLLLAKYCLNSWDPRHKFDHKAAYPLHGAEGNITPGWPYRPRAPGRAGARRV